MQVTNAFWEKRNLGVECNEIKIEDKDTESEIEKILLENEAEYTVVKVPSGKFDAMFLLSKLGYTYVESSMNLVHDLKNIPLSPIHQRIMNTITFTPMNDSDINLMCDEIRKGIYTTDRIYADPSFTNEQAANRYINWLMDEKERGTELFNLCHKDKIIGFFAFKDIGNNTCYPFLVAMYKDFLLSGLGLCTIEKPLKLAVDRGYKNYSTYVSSNNTSQINTHMLLGFKIKSMESVYVKHILK